VPSGATIVARMRWVGRWRRTATTTASPASERPAARTRSCASAPVIGVNGPSPAPLRRATVAAGSNSPPTALPPKAPEAVAP
jgi:hypothetical protein